MAEPRESVRQVMSVGAITVDEKLTLRSVAAVLAELDVGVVIVARPDGAPRSCRSAMSCELWQRAPSPTRSESPM